MQRLAPERPQGLAAASAARRLALVLKPAAIERVAEQRMADMGHMHADLMRAPGLELAAHEAREGSPAEAENVSSTS